MRLVEFCETEFTEVASRLMVRARHKVPLLFLALAKSRGSTVSA